MTSLRSWVKIKKKKKSQFKPLQLNLLLAAESNPNCCGRPNFFLSSLSILLLPKDGGKCYRGHNEKWYMQIKSASLPESFFVEEIPIHPSACVWPHLVSQNYTLCLPLNSSGKEMVFQWLTPESGSLSWSKLKVLRRRKVQGGRMLGRQLTVPTIHSNQQQHFNNAFHTSIAHPRRALGATQFPSVRLLLRGTRAI